MVRKKQKHNFDSESRSLRARVGKMFMDAGDEAVFKRHRFWTAIPMSK